MLLADLCISALEHEVERLTIRLGVAIQLLLDELLFKCTGNGRNLGGMTGELLRLTGELLAVLFGLLCFLLAQLFQRKPPVNVPFRIFFKRWNLRFKLCPPLLFCCDPLRCELLLLDRGHLLTVLLKLHRLLFQLLAFFL
ncbi:hypothetical protein D3C75_817130 [compost metagenome]